MFIVRFFGKVFGFIATNLFRLVRFGLVAGASLGIVLYTVDSYTNPKYGVANLYLIAGALSFFSLFVASFFEIYFWLLRKEKKNKIKRNQSYLKDEVKDELITRYNRKH